MEIIRIVWVFIFFFFALILIFTWSKMTIISGKIKAISRLIENIDTVSKPESEQKAQPEKPAQTQKA
jgi:hypothetical protein